MHSGLLPFLVQARARAVLFWSVHTMHARDNKWGKYDVDNGDNIRIIDRSLFHAGLLEPIYILAALDVFKNDEKNDEKWRGNKWWEYDDSDI